MDFKKGQPENSLINMHADSSLGWREADNKYISYWLDLKILILSIFKSIIEFLVSLSIKY